MASTKVISHEDEDDVIKQRVLTHKGTYTPLGPKLVFDLRFKTQTPPGLKKSFSTSDLQSMSPLEKLKLKDAKNTKLTFFESIGVPSLGMKKSVSLSSLESLSSKLACHEDLIRLSHSFKNFRSSYPGSGFGSSSFNKKALSGMSGCYANDCEHITYYTSPDGRRIRRTPVPHYIETIRPPICNECSKRHIPDYCCRNIVCYACFSKLHFSYDCPYFGYLPQGADFDRTRYMILCQFGHYFDLDRWCCPYCTGKQAKLTAKICLICLENDHICFECPYDVACAAQLKSEWENKCEAHANKLLERAVRENQSSQGGSGE